MGVSINPAVNTAIQLRNTIESFVDDPIKGSIGKFVAADAATIPSWLRSYQAAYRRSCDIYAATGAIGDLVGGAGLVFNPACGEYLGADLPQYNAGEPPYLGGECVGQLYNARIDFTETSGATGFINAADIPGPLSTNIELNGTVLRYRNFNNTQWIGVTTQPVASYSVSNVTITGGGDPRACGDPPSDPPSYEPTRPGPPPGPTFQYDDDDDGRPIQITIGDPSVNVDGTISLPITFGDTDLDLAGGTPGGTPEFTNDPGPDFENPSDPLRPGEDGQPEDGVDYAGPVSCALVVVTIEPPNHSIELGGPEDIFIQGWNSDAGWFRFVRQLGTTHHNRITSRTTMSCYCCEEKVADGFQAKFSAGYDGYVIIYPPKEE